MYVKPPRRQIHGVYVPENYNGTTFTEPADPSFDEPQPPEQAQPQASQPPETESIPAGKTEEKGPLSSLFSGFGGLRSDDILLLALIVLMSRGESGEGKHSTSEILPLLALLLFMG